MEVFISQDGCALYKSEELLIITNKKEKLEYSYRDVSSILISGNVRLTTGFLREAIENNIDIVILDKYGYPKGRFWNTGVSTISKIRKGQLLCSKSTLGLEISKQWIEDKVLNMNFHLSDLTKQQDLLDIIKFQNSLKDNVDLNSIRGFEGNVSKIYFSIVSQMLPKQFQFLKRSFRPALDEFNALVNYFLGILYNRIEKSSLIAGIDPNLGFFHRDDYNRPSFVFDFIEKYRYIAYTSATKFFRANKVRKSYFTNENNSFYLNDDGKKNLIPLYYNELNKSVTFKGKKIKTIDKIQQDLFEVAKYFIKIAEEVD
ncbi:CRISPR-associated endonuclease Cas1 [Candidatus Cetobacterium colombiensis]|uniref:CRISPR-associated endonuclease Cas1 n=1 Tax=Candidatus Cetobacterium colombiensis TaxID=3073100 RepID=A0ABU4WBV7_9FUSO|nr:CRISPR-associated endonuclease Cas1 [Candidatus Cetobacterium colombiensis]MDX8337022.1 CRISPR-associated endonuclease Cas1 [Candidatus Cetobacterium colombiensis]